MALVNTAKGISPFEMIDISEEDFDVIIQHYEDLHHATDVSTTYFRKVRAKLTAQKTASAEEFMLMLILFSNLFHALFTIQCPLYKKMYGIINSLCGYSPNTREQLYHKVKASIL